MRNAPLLPRPRNLDFFWVPGTRAAHLCSASDRNLSAGTHNAERARYYKQQAKTLLSWATSTKDQACARRLRVQAAEELERAERACEAVADINPLLAEFNRQELLKAR
jgi:hypothetical protein